MKTKEIIKTLLEQNPQLRDSDAKLKCRFWTNELKTRGIDTKKITAHQFLIMLSQNKLHNAEGLTRMRRKVQEENEDLRGDMYKERQTTQQNKMKAKLGYNEKIKVHMSCQVPKPYTFGSYDEY